MGLLSLQTHFPSCRKSDFIKIQSEMGKIKKTDVRERQISYDIAYMWDLKYDTNELIYKTETDSQT